MKTRISAGSINAVARARGRKGHSAQLHRIYQQIVDRGAPVDQETLDAAVALFQSQSRWRVRKLLNILAQPPKGGLRVVGTSLSLAGRSAGWTTLSLGEQRLGPNITKPVMHCVVPPGHHYDIGQNVTEFPRGTMTVRQMFGK